MGGSIAKSFKKHDISQNIWAFDIDSEALDLAQQENIIAGAVDLNGNLDEFDLIGMKTKFC